MLSSQTLYDLIHDNPSVIALDIGYANNPVNIAKNPKGVAINFAGRKTDCCIDQSGPARSL